MPQLDDAALPSLSTPFVRSVEQAFERYAAKPCLVFNDTTLSYADVDRASMRIALALINSELKRGAHCAVYADNSSDAVVVMLGILRAGCVWLPVNIRNGEQANLSALAALDCDLVFFSSAFEQVAHRYCELHPHAYAIGIESAAISPDTAVNELGLSNTQYFEHLQQWLCTLSKACEQLPSAIGEDPDALMALPMTGGTTGKPKGVMLTERNFRALSYAMTAQLARETNRDDGREGEGTRYLCAVPLTHVGGRIVLSALPSGACFILHKMFDATQVLDCIEQQRITDLFLPPTAIYALLAEKAVEHRDFSSLCEISYGAAPIATEQLRRALSVFGPVMRGLYGQTECPMMISALLPEQHYDAMPHHSSIASNQRLRSVGKATAISQIAILNEQGEACAVGERGQIAVRGPMVCAGYYKEPEQSAAIRSGDWHLTGDVGYLDEQGFLFVVDRLRDVVISGGFNVYTAEVEFALSSFQGVQAVAVVGMPHAKWGEQVVAFVQMRGDAVSDAAGDAQEAEQALIAHAKAQLGAVAAPKEIVFVESLPLTAIGKVDKRALRASYGAAVRST